MSSPFLIALDSRRHGNDWHLAELEDDAASWHQITLHMLDDPECAGVRVRRVDKWDDGLPVVDRHGAQFADPTQAPAPLYVLDAPLCTEYWDFFHLTARYCLHRLFDEWLRAKEISVTECLVSERMIERVMDGGTNVETTALRIAAAQALGKGKAIKRRDALLTLVDQVKKHAAHLTHEVGEAAISTPEGCVARLADAQKRHKGDSRFAYLPCAIIAHFLSSRRSRLAKLDALAQLLRLTKDPKSRNAIDGLIADLMVDDEIIQELSGPQPFTIEKLAWIAAAAVIDGDPPAVEPLSPYPFAKDVLMWVKEGELPETRKSILLALADLTGSSERFADLSDSREKAAILRLLVILSSGRLFVGGPRIARRLTQRYAHFETAGGRTGYLESMQTLTLDLGDLDKQIRYLAAIIWGSSDPKVHATAFREVDRCLRLYGGLDALFQRASDESHGLWARLDELCYIVSQIAPGPKSGAQWLKVIAETAMSPDAKNATRLSLKDAQTLIETNQIEGKPRPNLAEALRKTLIV